MYEICMKLSARPPGASFPPRSSRHCTAPDTATRGQATDGAMPLHPFQSPPMRSSRRGEATAVGALLHPDSVLTVTPSLGFLQSQGEDSGKTREGGCLLMGAGSRRPG